MKIINIIFVLLTIFSVKESFSLPFGPSPYERLRYNARFCRGDLKRLVYALSKSYTHKGCLKAGLGKLKDPKSKLYHQFDYIMPGAKESIGKGIVLKQIHRSETREILSYAIEQRLGDSSVEKKLSFTNTRASGKKLLAEDIAHFCALMGNYNLLSEYDYKDLTKRKNVDFKVLNASLILTLLGEIDVYKLFEEYRGFLNSFEKNKKVNPLEKKEVEKELKKIRDSFLTILDNLVVLKKRMSQNDSSYYTKEQLLAQRVQVKNAFASIGGMRDHVSRIEKAIKLLSPDQGKTKETAIGYLAQPYPNFFRLVTLIHHINLLNNQCLGRLNL